VSTPQAVQQTYDRLLREWENAYVALATADGETSEGLGPEIDAEKIAWASLCAYIEGHDLPPSFDIRRVGLMESRLEALEQRIRETILAKETA
jgi:hypothetical protein